MSDPPPSAETEGSPTSPTPGPWIAGINGNNRVYGPDNRGDDTGLIAVVYKGAANKHLIAAAPEMKEALQAAPDIHDYVTDTGGGETVGVQIIRFSRDFSVWSQRAKAALAKANGR